MSLTQRDARYLGFDTARLNYSDSYQAWGLVGYQANVTLREVRVNSLVMHNIKASVAKTSGADEVSPLGATS
jgi:predicted aspartyl protease